jgi:hypothetical protein
MKAHEIEIGHTYMVRLNGKFCRVKVNSINKMEGFRGRMSGKRVRSVTTYGCTNLETGRTVSVKSAAKFRWDVDKGVTKEQAVAMVRQGVNLIDVPEVPWTETESSQQTLDQLPQSSDTGDRPSYQTRYYGDGPDGDDPLRPEVEPVEPPAEGEEYPPALTVPSTDQLEASP